jgi:hypothetical protein
VYRRNKKERYEGTRGRKNARVEGRIRMGLRQEDAERK